MTKKEYYELIDKFLSNTDDLGTLSIIKENIETDTNYIESLAQKNKELEDKNKELRETNLLLHQKEFFRTGKEIIDEEPETDEEIFDRLIKNKFIKEN